MTARPSSAPPSSMPFAPGTVLAGKYRIDRLVGEGGMGWVVVATHLHLEQRVAVKFMRASDATSGSEAVARFLREARAAARIQSEHVARVSDFGTLENGAPYLVMEYLEGQDLEALLRSRGALTTEVAADYALQACEGLAEAHTAGIVHRDLKPANLFLARRTDGSIRVKLLDFGISKLSASGGAPEAAMTSTQALMGSPLYMAPEQMRSSKSVDARADIWSMGVILYEMLGGRPPFDGDTLPAVCARIMTEAPPALRSVRPGIPAPLEGVVMKCLEKDPAQRFPEVASLVRALAPFGGPEARSAADRIGRLVRASRASMVSLPDPDPSSEGRVEARPNRVAQTSATFTSTGGEIPGRRRALVPLAIGAGVLVLGGAVFGGLAAVRSTSSRNTAAAAPGAPAVAPPAKATPVPLPVAAPSVTPAPETPMPAYDPGTPVVFATAGPPTTPPPPAPAAPPTARRPAASPAPSSAPASTSAAHPAAHFKPAAPAPKAAATAGFGGRD